VETVGVRELKGNLSRYIQKVKKGEGVIVTERRKEVALILPYKTERDAREKILLLAQQGIVRWSGGKPDGMRSRVSLAGKKFSDAVLEDRR
jgi:prevent-host-death family protein